MSKIERLEADNETRILKETELLKQQQQLLNCIKSLPVAERANEPRSINGMQRTKWRCLTQTGPASKNTSQTA